MSVDSGELMVDSEESDTFECPGCLQRVSKEEAGWSELLQADVCFDCYCEIEEN